MDSPHERYQNALRKNVDEYYTRAILNKFLKQQATTKLTLVKLQIIDSIHLKFSRNIHFTLWVIQCRNEINLYTFDLSKPWRVSYDVMFSLLG